MGRLGKSYDDLNEPQAVLDFHDRGVLTGQDVKRMTTEFIHAARRKSLERVRIVTGKGVHSKGAPLVKPQVLRTLAELEQEGLVASYGTEKLTAGGDGAVAVRLS